MPLLEGTTGVPAALVAVLEDVSSLGPVAYLEAEFWGGDGCQASVVWDARSVVHGPIVEQDAFSRAPLGDGAINQALRRLGVRVGEGAPDEFATVGLGRHRRSEAWLE